MKTIAISSFNAPPTLRDDLAAPTAGAGEVLVRVHATSVNPVDRAIATGMFEAMFEHSFPIVLGRDYAGVVEEVGSGVTRYAPGDEVYGFLPPANPTVHSGSWAELVVVPEDAFVASRPAGIELAAAGAAPLAGVTALLSLDALELSEGDTLVVVGAGGGVGSFAVQLAARAGVTVLGTGLPEDVDYLKDLGVATRLDRDADVAAAVLERHPEGADGLLDLVSYTPEGFAANAAALRSGGRGVSPLMVAGDGPGRTNIVAQATPENLGRLGELLTAGELRVTIGRSYPFADAGAALADLSTTHKHGKLAIEVA